MGTVFRKTYTVALPPGAELFEKSRNATAAERSDNPDLREVVERFARWKDKRGKLRTERATVGADGLPRLHVDSGSFVAEFADREGFATSRSQ